MTDFAIDAPTIRLALFSYIDEGVHVVYAPALDLFGYGTDEAEARQSFDLVLDEYLIHTAQNHTLTADLRANGWNFGPDSQIVTAPELHETLRRNPDFYQLIQSRPFRKFDRVMVLPIML
jgi:hypothetical protein